MINYSQLSDEEKAERNRLYNENLAKERADRKAKEREHVITCNTIAALFGCTVEPSRNEEDHETYGYYNYFSLTNGVNLNFDRYNNKITISGSYPEGQTRDQAKSISMSKDKTAEQIFKDINRRFMPEYKIKYEQAVQRYNEANDYKNRVNNTRQELLNINGISEHGREQVYIKKGELYGWTESISGNGTCSLILRGVTVDQLKALLGVIV